MHAQLAASSTGVPVHPRQARYNKAASLVTVIKGMFPVMTCKAVLYLKLCQTAGLEFSILQPQCTRTTAQSKKESPYRYSWYWSSLVLIQHSINVTTLLHVLQEPELEEEKARNFSILQPGSSVATALSEGESKRKHIMVLEILGEQWRTIKVALKTVRPFVFESVSQHAHASVYKPVCAPDTVHCSTHSCASKMPHGISMIKLQCNCTVRWSLCVQDIAFDAALGALKSCVGGHQSTCIMQIVLAKQKGLNPDEPEVGPPTCCMSPEHCGLQPECAADYIIARATLLKALLAAG